MGDRITGPSGPDETFGDADKSERQSSRGGILEGLVELNEEFYHAREMLSVFGTRSEGEPSADTLRDMIDAVEKTGAPLLRALKEAVDIDSGVAEVVGDTITDLEDYLDDLSQARSRQEMAHVASYDRAWDISVGVSDALLAAQSVQEG